MTAGQLELHAGGADVALGTVRPDFADLTAEHAAHWVATHPRGRPAGNVHGANLGLRADTYLAAGGSPISISTRTSSSFVPLALWARG